MALATISMVACMQEEVVTVPKTSAITFDNAFIDNATRAADDPSTTTASIENFNVWGFMDSPDGTVFVAEDVQKSGAVWYYANTQYWTPNHTYYFAALSPMDSANWSLDASGANTDGAGVVSFTNVDGSEDLIYAATSVATPVRYDDLVNDGMDPVKLQFNHLLSKVKFTFTNGFKTDNAFVEVKNIKMTSPKTGTLALNTPDWWVGDKWDITGATKFPFEFGNVAKLSMGVSDECAVERLLIPASAAYEYDITFDVVLYMGTEVALETSKTSTLTALALQMGKAYNFTAEINPENLALPAIEFEVEVLDWDQVADVPVYGASTVFVNTAAEFAAAVSDPDVTGVVLNENIELTGTLTRAGENETVIAKSFVLDGNGKTLTYNGSGRVIDIVSDVENATDKDVTIKNVTINCTASYLERGINYNANGTLILDGVKFTGTAPTYAVNFPGKADNAYVTIKNCEVTGNIALNVWGQNMRIDVENSVLSNYDKNSVEDYCAVKLNNDGSTIADGTVVNVKDSKVLATNENGEPAIAFYNASETGVFVIDDATEVVGDNKVQVAIVYFESSPYNFYGCTSLSDAIATMLKHNGTGIRITRDIELDEPVEVAKDQTVVIDLNGKTISAVDETTANYELIKNAGNLTIFGGGKMTVKATQNSGWNRYSAVIANVVGGNLTVKDVVLEHLGGTDMAYGIDNLTNGKGTSAVTTIEGATVKSPYRAVRQFLNGTEATNELYVKAGSVLEGANKSIFFHDPSKNANTGKLVVEAGAQLKGDVYLFVTAGSTEWPVEVSIAESAFVKGTVMTGNVPAGMLVMKKDGNWVVLDAEEEGYTVVYTAEELNKLNVKNAYVVLGADIDFQGAAMTNPIQLWGDSTFDGMGHKISNVKTAVQGGYATSLFRGDANPGNKVVKNLVIENLTTPAGYSYASAIWSDLQGANIEIDNVTINKSTLESTGTVGGFVGFVSASTTSVVIKNSSINNSNLNGGEADHKRGAVVGRAYGCTVTCEDVVVDNVKINGAAATTSTLVGDKGYTGTVTVK